MQHMVSLTGGIEHFYNDRNTGKIILMDTVSLAAEQIAQNADDLIGCLIICHTVNSGFIYQNLLRI